MIVKTETVTLFDSQNPLALESGKSLESLTLAYETYGTLNETKDNVILVCHALSGDAHAVGESEDGALGWWDNFIGPGKTIDTERFFVLCSNVIGGCKGSTGPSSINPKTNAPYGTDFPVITITDMVNAQKALVDHLGITKLLMVIGGSMGGMQAIQWAISFPDLVKTCVPIAATAKLSPQALAFDAVGRNAITYDQNWTEGSYYSNENAPIKGLAIARMIGHITYLSDQSMTSKFGRKLQKKENYSFDHSTDFQLESYLEHQGNKFLNQFDPNSYIYLTKAISYFDLEKSYGSLEKAFDRCNSQFLIISISSDWLYTPAQSKAIVKALMKLNKNVTYCDIESPYGHDAFLIENTRLNQIVGSFLERQDHV